MRKLLWAAKGTSPLFEWEVPYEDNWEISVAIASFAAKVQTRLLCECLTSQVLLLSYRTRWRLGLNL
jgi:hypothetical protein